jgi:glycosyltransferase involved in cell wall biosynthesis
MDKQLQLTVAMPVYNAGPYLTAAVESILNQTYSEFEFIIIDDGSTDDSLAILQRYAGKDTRIKLISRENRGLVATRNELLSLAHTKYFAIMDSDDVSYPHRLERQLSFLENQPDYGIVGCRDMLIDPDGLDIRVINDNVSHEDIDRANLSFDVFQTLNAYMAVTEQVKAIGGYRDKIVYAEDRDVFLRMAEITKVMVLSDILYAYRQHYTNTCVMKANEVSFNVRQVVDDACLRRKISLASSEAGSHPENITVVQLHNVWAWWALAGGNIKTARKYARKVFMKRPLSINSWRLLLCVSRGY